MYTKAFRIYYWIEALRVFLFLLWLIHGNACFLGYFALEIFDLFHPILFSHDDPP